MELLDNLKKKQDEEFEKFNRQWTMEGYLPMSDLSDFIDKVRSETAEAVKEAEKDRIYAYLEEYLISKLSQDEIGKVANIVFNTEYLPDLKNSNSLKE